MKIENGSRGNVIYGARIIAFFLVAGGLLGILGSVLMGFRLAQQHQSLPVIIIRHLGSVIGPFGLPSVRPWKQT